MAYVALIGLRERFDPTLGVPFALYARQRLRGAMLDAIDTEARHSHGMVSPHRRDARRGDDQFAFEQISEDYLYPATAPVQDRCVAVEQSRQILTRLAKEVLNGRQRVVLYFHYERGLASSEIAKMLGVSTSRISQIHVAALSRLRDELRLRGIQSSRSLL